MQDYVYVHTTHVGVTVMVYASYHINTATHGGDQSIMANAAMMTGTTFTHQQQQQHIQQQVAATLPTRLLRDVVAAGTQY